MKFQHNQRLDTWDTLEELSPGDRITIDGNPATVFDLEEGSEPWIIYVLDGRKTKKQLSMYDALLPSETAEDEEDEWDDDYGEPDPNFVEKPEVEVRYIAPGKDLFDEPGIRKSPGRRNRPMTSHVPPVAEGKIMKIDEVRMMVRKLLREMGYGDFAATPEVQDMLMDAGFNADGSFGADGYPGPSDWQLYSPETIEDAAGWIQAALDMNQALKDAEAALNAGEFKDGQGAWYEVVYPVQQKYSKHGASDTEGREVAGNWLEDKGFEWSGW